MYISQPTLSRHIADLENTLNVELFERTTRKVSLTAAGVLFLNEAKQIIKRYDALMSRTVRLGSGISGSLRIGYLELFTQDVLPVALKNFRTKFPLVELTLKESTFKGAQRGLMDGSLDVAFVVSHTSQPPLDDELEHKRIYTGQVELIVSNTHPYAGYKIVSPAILENEQILTFDAEETPELRENITKMCILLLIMGCFFDSGAAVLILAPLLLPAAKALGINPVHLGIVFTVNLSIGMFTPPFGMNIFVAQSVLGEPMSKISKALVPFILLYIAALLVITYVPAFSLALL